MLGVSTAGPGASLETEAAAGARRGHQGRARRLAIILAAGLGLVACSGESGQSQAGPPAASATTPATATTSAADPATTSAASPATSTPRAAATTVPPEAAVSEPAAATTAAGLAAQLTEAETAIREPATPASRLARLARLQQRAYRALGRRPGLLAEVLPRVPARLRPVVRANATAAGDLLNLSRPGPRLPRWRIVAPAPASELLAAYHSAEAALGVPWTYLAAIHLVETKLGRIQGASAAGAKGPMQFMPSTWRRYGAGGDISSTHDAILAAARMLRANGAPRDMAAALYAYNHSSLYVRAVTAYAQQLRADPRAFLGYYHWQVYYGDTLLPEGYPKRPAQPAP
jgi:membrane-bound lytic murein transglycosylase B